MEREQKLKDSKWMLDLIIAPEISEEAKKVLFQRKRSKVFVNPALFDPNLTSETCDLRFVRGGSLRQPPGNYILDFKECEGDRVSMEDKVMLDSLIIAWAAAWSSALGGNEIALAKERKLISSGGGPSTIDACEVAIVRARTNGQNLAESVFAADAFFPFTDVPERLVQIGVKQGIVPKGGINFINVEKYFIDNKINMFYLNEENRGFCRH